MTLSTGEMIGATVGAVVVATEWILIRSLREVTREIRTARKDVPRALALLALGNVVIAGVVGRARGQETTEGDDGGE